MKKINIIFRLTIGATYKSQNELHRTTQNNLRSLIQNLVLFRNRNLNVTRDVIGMLNLSGGEKHQRKILCEKRSELKKEIKNMGYELNMKLFQTAYRYF